MNQGSGVYLKVKSGKGRTEVFHVSPGAGELMRLGAVGARLKVAGSQTGGQYSVVEHPLAPGALVPPHRHAREDELMYVLEGEIGARVGDRVLHAAQGSYVFKPRNVSHAFWNEKDEPALVMHVLSPAGFEGYFEDLHDLIPKSGQPDFDQVTRLAARYGVVFQLDWVPELEKRFGVSVYGRGPLPDSPARRRPR